MQGDLERFASLLDRSWQFKKRTANRVTNKFLDSIYDLAQSQAHPVERFQEPVGVAFLFYFVQV